MPSVHNRVGKRYGKLTVISRAVNDKHGNAQWFCSCECGVHKVVNGCCLQQGDAKSCGCVVSHLRPYESLYNRLIAMTKHPVDMTYEEFETFTREEECHYCGYPLVWRERYAGKGGWQLDRKDTNKGYSVDNCVACCKRCNFGKGDRFTYAEWKEIGNVIREWKK